MTYSFTSLESHQVNNFTISQGPRKGANFYHKNKKNMFSIYRFTGPLNTKKFPSDYMKMTKAFWLAYFIFISCLLIQATTLQFKWVNIWIAEILFFLQAMFNLDSKMDFSKNCERLEILHRGAKFWVSLFTLCLLTESWKKNSLTYCRKSQSIASHFIQRHKRAYCLC